MIDRSMPQEHCGFGGSTVSSQSDRSFVMAVGAFFVDTSMVCRHEHCFVDRSIVLAAEALFCPSLKGALFGRHEHCFADRSMVLSTGAMPCRPVHSIIDRSMPTGVLWFWRQEHCFVPVRQEHGFGGRSIVLSTGALFGRQEPCDVDRSTVLSTGACPQEHRGLDGSIVLSA